MSDRNPCGSALSRQAAGAISLLRRLTRPDVLLMGAGLLISLCYLYRNDHNQVYLRYNDVFYYVSLGDAILETGLPEDRTTIPATPAKTLQNGAAWVYAGLIHSGLSHRASIRSMVFISYAIWILAIPAFWGLIRKAEIQGPYVRAFLVLAFLATHTVLVYQLIPGTDSIYNAGTLWLLLAFHEVLLPTANPAARSDRKRRLITWIVLCLLAAVLVHFSIRLLVYVIAVPLALILTRASRRTVLHALLPLVAALVSLAPMLIVADTSRMRGQAVQLFGGVYATLHAAHRVFLVYVGGEPWFPDLIAWAIALGSLACFVTAVALGVRKREFFPVALGLIPLLMVAVLVLSLPPRWFEQSADRYLMSTAPLAWLLAMRVRRLRPLVMLGIALIALRTFSMSIRSRPPSNQMAFISYLWQRDLQLPPHAILLSQYARHTYVVLGGRSSALASAAPLHSGQVLWLCGNENFRAETLQDVLASGSVSIASANPVTADYNDAVSHAVVVVKLGE